MFLRKNKQKVIEKNKIKNRKKEKDENERLSNFSFFSFFPFFRQLFQVSSESKKITGNNEFELHTKDRTEL